MKVLCLSGGGVFGIGQAKILSKIDCSKFDVFAGTSIGSVIAASLAMNPSNNKNLSNLLLEDMPKIFEGHYWRQYNIFPPKYKDIELNNSLQRQFNKYILLKDAKKPLFITTVNVLVRKLKVFYSGDSYDGRFPMWEVLRKATAAETYFNPWKDHADGGIFANDPVMVAIAGITKEMGVEPEDIEICSIGTGSADLTKTDLLTDNKTVLGYGLWVLDSLLKGAANSMHEYFAKSLHLKKYVKIDFTRQPGWQMDNPNDMLDAIDKWDLDIKNAIKIVDKF